MGQQVIILIALLAGYFSVVIVVYVFLTTHNPIEEFANYQKNQFGVIDTSLTEYLGNIYVNKNSTYKNIAKCLSLLWVLTIPFYLGGLFGIFFYRHIVTRGNDEKLISSYFTEKF